MSNGAVANGLDRQGADLSLSGGRGDEGKAGGRSGGSYVPPHLRGRQGGGGDSEPPRNDHRGGGGGYGRGSRDGGRVWDEARGAYSRDDRHGGDRGGPRGLFIYLTF